MFTSKIERVSWNDHKQNNQIYIGLLNLNNKTNLTQTNVIDHDVRGEQVFESFGSSPFLAQAASRYVYSHLVQVEVPKFAREAILLEGRFPPQVVRYHQHAR